MWDFLKNAVVEDINAVPEQWRGFYVEGADKKFTVSPQAKPLVDAYTGTNAALEKTRKDLAAANGESASRRVTKQAVIDFAKKLGLENIDDENPLTTLESHYTDLVGKIGKGGELKVNLENIKKDYETRNKAIVDDSNGKVAKMQASLEKYMIGNAALVALAKHGGNAALLQSIVKSAAKVVADENGEFSVRILDEAGSPRSNGAGGWLDIDGYVGELKSNATYAAAFASEAKGGTGKKPGSEHNPAPGKKTDGERTSVDKIASGLQKGQFQRAGA
jgi:hypothetical protein